MGDASPTQIVYLYIAAGQVPAETLAELSERLRVAFQIEDFDDEECGDGELDLILPPDVVPADTAQEVAARVARVAATLGIKDGTVRAALCEFTADDTDREAPPYDDHTLGIG